MTQEKKLSIPPAELNSVAGNFLLSTAEDGAGFRVLGLGV